MMRKKHRYFAIFGMMRTGSNLLERNLNQFRDLQCHGELFNPSFVGKAKSTEYLGVSLAMRENDPDELIARILEDDDEVLPGFRIFPDHDPRIQKRAATDPDCARIILKRDPLDSYLSLKIARETDQWMLGDESRRKSAKTTFDVEEYETYLRTRADFYDTLSETIHKAGLTAYHIHFETLKSVAMINGLAQYIGSLEKLRTLTEKIKQQNPDDAAEKVDNPDELSAYLRQTGTNAVAGAATRLRSKGTRNWVRCRNQPIAFAPIPSGPYDAVLQQMALREGVVLSPDQIDAAIEAGGCLETGAKRGEVDEWLSAGRLQHIFSVTRHPMTRAYDIFMTRIFHAKDGRFARFREAITERYDVALPDIDVVSRGSVGALAGAGYDVADHRQAFVRFLEFLRQNMSHKTSIPIDGVWAPQVEHLAGIGNTAPLRIIGDEARLPAVFAYLDQCLGIDLSIEVGKRSIKDLLGKPKPAPTPLPQPPAPRYLFPLSAVWNEEAEKLCRQAYSKDYGQLGYGSWRRPTSL